MEVNGSRLVRFPWGSASGGRRWVWLAGIGAGLVILAALIYSGASGRLRAGRGLNLPRVGKAEPSITVFLHKTGERRTMKMEDYIAGVVAAEMDPSWPKEALASQALLARTFTVERLSRTGGVRHLHGTDACDSPEHFQAFDPGRVNENVRQAVARTRGVIVAYGGQPIKAYYHANSGGQTATLEEGGFPDRGLPYIKSIKDVTGTTAAGWRAEFPLTQVARAVARAGSGQSTAGLNVLAGEGYPRFDLPGEGTFAHEGADAAGSGAGEDGGVQMPEKGVAEAESAPRSVKIDARGPSGRVVSFDVDGRKIPAAAMRLGLGSTRMRSTLIDSVEVRDGKLVMVGRGYGHGVGLSQWGAKVMAEQGRAADEIIQYYFKGVRFARQWD